MSRRDHPNDCPIARTAELVGDFWTLLIVRDLGRQSMRFNGLLASLEGVSSRTLAQRLKALEQAGMIRCERFSEIPPRVEYSLTERGLALLPVVEDMRAFGQTWLPVQLEA
ncbi:winged helix-turn-helix transcriptional regulator [Rubrobacter aplysinae]|uniref:winged helix-turn-helix transcriptional regulator n=1 Tax=Rubrobacter aplysinae TaxID=909625 RepID=UPI00064BEDB2|nr:helix-turn-helix domain-containing protein [Rubrobacter aplysinae]